MQLGLSVKRSVSETVCQRSGLFGNAEQHDLYFFIIGVYRLVSGSWYGRFHAFLGELHEAPAFLLDLLPACDRSCGYRCVVFHLRLCLRRTNS